MLLIVLIIFLLRLAYAKGNKKKQKEIKELYNKHLTSLLTHPLLLDLISTYYVSSKEFGIITKDYSTIKTIALGICTYTTIWATTRPCDIAFKIHHLRTSRRQWGKHHPPLSACNTRELSIDREARCWSAVKLASKKDENAQLETFDFVLNETFNKGLDCGSRISKLYSTMEFQYTKKKLGQIFLNECRNLNCGYACENLSQFDFLMEDFKKWKGKTKNQKVNDELIVESLRVLSFFLKNEEYKKTGDDLQGKGGFPLRFIGGSIWYHPYFKGRNSLVIDLVESFLKEFFPEHLSVVDLSILTPEGNKKYNENFRRFIEKLNLEEKTK